MCSTSLRKEIAAHQASATLIQEPGVSSALTLVNNLPHLPEGQQYQLWKIAGQGPVPAGIFGDTDSVKELEILSANFLESDAIGVIVEPQGGVLS